MREWVRACVRACVSEWVSEWVRVRVSVWVRCHAWMSERMSEWMTPCLTAWVTERATSPLSYPFPKLLYAFSKPPLRTHFLVFAFEASYWQPNTTSSQFPANLRLFARWSLYPLDQLGKVTSYIIYFRCNSHQSWREHHYHCYHPHELDK